LFILAVHENSGEKVGYYINRIDMGEGDKTDYNISDPSLLDFNPPTDKKFKIFAFVYEDAPSF